MASTDPARPNILLVFADDLATWAVGAYGSPDAYTPTLDGLAAAGCTFEQFFCTSPVCSPARASLLTGRIPSQHGVHDWIRGGNAGAGRIDFLEGQPTLHEALSSTGYRCGMIGKWHLGASDKPRPAFDEWYAYEKGGGVYYGAPMYRGSQLENPTEYLSDVLAKEAVDFISCDSGDTPFYLNLSFTAPHYPWVDAHPQELLDLYADSKFENIPREPSHPWLLLQNPETAAAIKDPESSLRGYFAAVSGLDRALGTVLAAIASEGLESSTLVAFVGDNGFNAGHHGIWGKGNGTLPQNMFDTSVRVPAIFSQPGRIPPGTRTDQMVSGYDLLPTILDYVGAANSTPAQILLPGASHRDTLDGLPPAADRPVVVYDEYGPVRMIRTNEWKLILRHPDGPHELFHLANDPDERVNLIDDPAFTKIRERLRGELIDWFDRFVDPTFNGVELPVLGLGQLLPLPGETQDTTFVPMGPPGIEAVLE